MSMQRKMALFWSCASNHSESAVSTMTRQGDYQALSRMVRNVREESHYEEELRIVLRHCRDALAQMRPLQPTGFNARAKIWARIVDAVDIAEQELKRLGGGEKRPPP